MEFGQSLNGPVKLAATLQQGRSPCRCTCILHLPFICKARRRSNRPALTLVVPDLGRMGQPADAAARRRPLHSATPLQARGAAVLLFPARAEPPPP